MSEKIGCMYCKSEIPLGAKKCIACGSLQSKWKSRFSYLGQIAGLLAILSSAAVFLVNSIPVLKRHLMWSESLSVLSLDKDSVVFANTGDGDLFVKSLEYFMFSEKDIAATTTVPIKKLVHSGTVFEYKFPRYEKKAGKNTYTIMKGYVSIGDKTWSQITSDLRNNNTCYELEILDSDNPQYKQVKAAYKGRGPVTLPHKALIHVFAMKSQENMQIPFDVVGIVSQSDATECVSPNK